MTQDSFDWTQARAARDAGIQMAADHADAVVPKWSDAAYEILVCYCKRSGFGARFTSEDVRAYADKAGLISPPHLRAWGGVFQRAARCGLVSKAGTDTAKSTNVHCAIITVWRVN